MSKMDFLLNLRIARGFFENRVTSDDGAADVSKLSDALDRADLWLTRTAVKGFREEDFPELTDSDRAELARAVRRFDEIARQVPDNGPASKEQASEARPLLERMIELTRPELPRDVADEKMAEAVAEAKLPGVVKSYLYRIGEDSTGDDAIWVTLFIDDRLSESPDFFRAAQSMQQRLRDSMFKHGLTYWPYFSFKTVSDTHEFWAESYHGVA